MAIVDIDRHILSEIIVALKEIQHASTKYSVAWNKIVIVRDKSDALMFSINGCETPTKVCSCTKEELRKLRNIFFIETKRCEKEFLDILIQLAKQEALLMHIVSLIKEVDTKKGLETKEK